MAKIGDKLLSFIGLESTDEEEYDNEYDDQDMMEDDLDFPPDDFVAPAPVEMCIRDRVYPYCHHLFIKIAAA